MKLVKISITRTIAAVSVALFAALPSFADPIYVSTTASSLMHLQTLPTGMRS